MIIEPEHFRAASHHRSADDLDSGKGKTCPGRGEPRNGRDGLLINGRPGPVDVSDQSLMFIRNCFGDFDPLEIAGSCLESG